MSAYLGAGHVDPSRAITVTIDIDLGERSKARAAPPRAAAALLLIRSAAPEVLNTYDTIIRLIHSIPSTSIQTETEEPWPNGSRPGDHDDLQGQMLQCWRWPPLHLLLS